MPGTLERKGPHMISRSKIAIIGAGAVGSTTAYALMTSHLALDIVLVDVNRDKAEGDAMDMMHGAAYAGPSRIVAGGYEDCAGSDIVIITAGAGQKSGETRIDLLKKNADLTRSIVAEIMRYCPNPILLAVSNPVDILARLCRELTGLDRKRVIGSGTVLDSSRFKYLVSECTGVDPKSIHAYIIGEHGDSEVAVWSRTSIAGLLYDEYCIAIGKDPTVLKPAIEKQVVEAAYEVIAKKGATFYAVALAVRRIVECILQDERAILTVSTALSGQYGISDVYLSLPSVVGKNGVEMVLPITYADDEMTKLAKSAAFLDENYRSVVPG